MSNTKRLFTDIGHLNDEGVALFVDALKLHTVAQLPADVRDHVADCTDCKKNITGVFAVVRNEDYSLLSQHPYLILNRTARRRAAGATWRIAAAIGGVALASALIYYLVARNSEGNIRQSEHVTQESARESVAVAAPELAPQAAHTEQYAAAFTPSPEYESLVETGTRSFSISEVRPANGSTNQGIGIVFSWKASPQKALQVVVMDNTGAEVWVSTRSLPPIAGVRKLMGGLYYWKLTDGEEAVHVGKFTVR
ncbi:MAG: hypothetical protein AB1428_09840 [Bacteroidota bacterium]